MKDGINRKGLILSVLFCLTLGLAPFGEEPHLFGKLRWVKGGAVGMQAMDWFDLFIHGAPFLLLAFFIGRILISVLQNNKQSKR